MRGRGEAIDRRQGQRLAARIPIRGMTGLTGRIDRSASRDQTIRTARGNRGQSLLGTKPQPLRRAVKPGGVAIDIGADLRRRAGPWHRRVGERAMPIAADREAGLLQLARAGLPLPCDCR